MLLLIYVGAVGGIALFGREIVGLTGGPSYAGSVPILILLGCAVAVDQMCGIYQTVFHLVRKPQWILAVQTVTAAVGALAVFLAARVGGGIGAAGAILGTAVVGNLACYAVSRSSRSGRC